MPRAASKGFPNVVRLPPAIKLYPSSAQESAGWSRPVGKEKEMEGMKVGGRGGGGRGRTDRSGQKWVRFR